MALHGQIQDIIFLLEKYPLVHASGWTVELEEENQIQKKSILYMVDRSGNETYEKLTAIGTTFAMVFSNLKLEEVKKFREKIPLSEKEITDASDFGEEITKRLT
jgi:hypothetical protein